MSGNFAFEAARNFLLTHRTDYNAALRDFSWPRMERFNWALDYFDAIAAGNTKLALHIVEEDGRETQLTQNFPLGPARSPITFARSAFGAAITSW